MKQTLWKSNRNFVKDVPFKKVNLIVITISEEKKGGITFVPTFVLIPNRPKCQ
jgi:hypothetical protein